MVACRCRVPWVAMRGSQAAPLVMTACRCLRIAAAMTAFSGTLRGLSVEPVITAGFTRRGESRWTESSARK